MTDKMKDLLTAVRHLTQQEYRRAEAKFGSVNHSAHESYAIILEEVREHRDAEMALDKALQEFWASVCRNKDPQSQRYDLRDGLEAALQAAAEMIQVAAMFYKAGLTANDYIRDSFTKWDLRDGHIVMTRDLCEYEYYQGAFYHSNLRYMDLSWYEEDLTCVEAGIAEEDRSSWDIVVVYFYRTADGAGIAGWRREGWPE